MKVILHTEFDIFTYKAVGAAVGILIYALLAYKFPQFDLLVANVIAFLIGSFAWYVLSFIVINKGGICIKFIYAMNRPGIVCVVLRKGVKELGRMEYELLIDFNNFSNDIDRDVPSKLKRFLYTHIHCLKEVEELHFVGCTELEVREICELLEVKRYDCFSF